MQKALGSTTPTVPGWKGSLSLEFAIGRSVWDLNLSFILQLLFSLPLLSSAFLSICLRTLLVAKELMMTSLKFEQKKKSTITYSVD